MSENYFKFGFEANYELRNCMRTIIHLKLLQLLNETNDGSKNETNDGSKNETNDGSKNETNDGSKSAPKQVYRNFDVKLNDEEVLSKTDNIKSLERVSDQQLSLNKELNDCFECEICFGKFDLKDGITFGCEHRFCGLCLSDYLSTQISEGMIETMICPHPKCEAKASQLIIEQLVAFPLYERYVKLQIQKGISAMDDVFYCPNTNCEAIVECEVDVGMGCCGECGHAFCTSCLREYHGTSDCHLSEYERQQMLRKYQMRVKAEEQEEELRIALEEKQKRKQQDIDSELFIKKAFKKCPGCQSDVEKKSGCNRIHCIKCSNNFCWLCLQLLSADNNTAYQHFGTKCHINS